MIPCIPETLQQFNVDRSRRAIYSRTQSYRYLLSITWNRVRPSCMFVGLNPSTATELQDDPTIRKCRGFAERWGCGTLHMTNIFAWRDTDPKLMKRARKPVGDYNDHYLLNAAEYSSIVVAAWGRHGTFMGRGREVAELLRDCSLQMFRRNADGTPIHPLYQPYDRELQDFA